MTMMILPTAPAVTAITIVIDIVIDVLVLVVMTTTMTTMMAEEWMLHSQRERDALALDLGAGEAGGQTHSPGERA